MREAVYALWIACACCLCGRCLRLLALCLCAFPLRLLALGGCCTFLRDMLLMNFSGPNAMVNWSCDATKESSSRYTGSA